MLAQDTIIKNGMVRTKDSIMECPHCKSTFQKDHVRTRMRKWGKDSFYSTKHCPNCDKRILLRDDNPDIESVNTRLSKLRTYCNYCKMNGQFDEYRDVMSEILELQKQIEDMRNGEMNTKVKDRNIEINQGLEYTIEEKDKILEKFGGKVHFIYSGGGYFRIDKLDDSIKGKLMFLSQRSSDSKKLMKDAALVALKKLGQVKKQIKSKDGLTSEDKRQIQESIRKLESKRKEAIKAGKENYLNSEIARLKKALEEPTDYFLRDTSPDLKSKITAFFKANPNPDDDKVHAFAEQNGINPHELEEEIYKLVTEHVGMVKDKKTKDDFPVGAKVKYVGKYADPALTNARATIVGAGNDKGVGGGNMVRIRFDNGREAIVPYMDVEHTNDSKKTKDDIPSPKDTYNKIRNFDKIALQGFARRIGYPELSDLKKMDTSSIIAELISFLHGEKGDQFLENPNNFKDSKPTTKDWLDPQAKPLSDKVVIKMKEIYKRTKEDNIYDLFSDATQALGISGKIKEDVRILTLQGANYRHTEQFVFTDSKPTAKDRMLKGLDSLKRRVVESIIRNNPSFDSKKTKDKISVYKYKGFTYEYDNENSNKVSFIKTPSGKVIKEYAPNAMPTITGVNGKIDAYIKQVAHDKKTKDASPADKIKDLLQNGYSLKDAILKTEKSIGRQLNAFEAAEAVAVSKKMGKTKDEEEGLYYYKQWQVYGKDGKWTATRRFLGKTGSPGRGEVKITAKSFEEAKSKIDDYIRQVGHDKKTKDADMKFYVEKEGANYNGYVLGVSGDYPQYIMKKHGVSLEDIIAYAKSNGLTITDLKVRDSKIKDQRNNYKILGEGSSPDNAKYWIVEGNTRRKVAGPYKDIESAEKELKANWNNE